MMSLARRVAPWVVLTSCVLFVLGTIVLTLASEAAALGQGSKLTATILPLGFIAFGIVGTIVASRRPDNILGWLFLLAGLVFTAGAFAEAYGAYRPGPLAGARYAAWVMHWSVQSPSIFSFFTFFFLLFPDGRPRSPRWRRMAIVSGVATAAFVLLVMFKPGELAESNGVENPFALAFLGPVWRIVELPLVLVVMGSVPVAAVSFVLRYRSSRGVERQQLKWFAASGVFVGCLIAAAPVVFSTPSLWWIWPFLFVIATTSVPVAAGIAILRYRLYEIDRIIRRTLSYAVITVVLGATYLAVVVTVQRVAVGASGDFAVAGATLAVAAIFGPVRRRVQQAVDHRFNRKRYDAERTVAAFSSRLREQVDIDALTEHLRGVVQETLDPAMVSVWHAKHARRA